MTLGRVVLGKVVLGKVVLGTVVASLALTAALWLADVGPFSGTGDQCAKPVSERTGAWVCYEPDGR